MESTKNNKHVSSVLLAALLLSQTLFVSNICEQVYGVRHISY